MVDDFIVFIGIFGIVFSWQAHATSTRGMLHTVEGTYLIYTMMLVSALLVLSDDVLIFYTSFEVLLIVMYAYLALRVYTRRASYAMLILVVYTILGGALLGCGYLLVYVIHGATSCSTSPVHSAYGSLLSVCSIIIHIGLLCKIPSYPMHVWLMEAHVESSTEGSIVLAGVYLKIGLIGWIRYCILLHNSVVQYVAPGCMTLCVIGVMSCIPACAGTLDMKRFAAISSVLHMQLCCMCGTWVYRLALLLGVVLQSIAHSWVASILFSLIGESYEIHGARCMKHFAAAGSASYAMLLVLLMNSGFPCSLSYVAEVNIMAHAMNSSVGMTVMISVVAGVLATVGLVSWMHMSMGRARVHTGVHTATQGQSLTSHMTSIGTLLVSVFAGTASSTV